MREEHVARMAVTQRCLHLVDDRHLSNVETKTVSIHLSSEQNWVEKVQGFGTPICRRPDQPVQATNQHPPRPELSAPSRKKCAGGPALATGLLD